MAKTSEKFYITTTLPYVNADPHIGFALEIIQADIIARYQKELLGKDTFFNTGTDEHGIKIYRKAQELGKDPQAYVDEYAAKFDELKDALDLSYGHFIRTSNPDHKQAAQEFWKRCSEHGYIFKKLYKVKYCVGCELEKTDSELVDGKCPIHPNLEIEIIEEENYFFKFSAFQQPLLDFYEQHPDFVVPAFRFNEIKEFVKAGLQDFSISRLKEKMPWGIPVPDDDEQVMYVWFDALINYISTTGWPANIESFEKWWGTASDLRGVQIAGKDNLRQQSAMWQAMLMAADLPNSKQIIIHGFITSDGQKMSKSLGNVVGPYDLLEKLQSHGLSKAQATDALRYWVAREANTFEDSDYTWDKFVEAYNANLANGIGNLTSRILKMAQNAGVTIETNSLEALVVDSAFDQLKSHFDRYELQQAADLIWQNIQEADEYIQQQEPFKKIKVDETGAKKDIEFLLYHLEKLSVMLAPFLPHTSSQIAQALRQSEAEIPRLFPRIEKHVN